MTDNRMTYYSLWIYQKVDRLKAYANLKRFAWWKVASLRGFRISRIPITAEWTTSSLNPNAELCPTASMYLLSKHQGKKRAMYTVSTVSSLVQMLKNYLIHWCIRLYMGSLVVQASTNEQFTRPVKLWRGRHGHRCCNRPESGTHADEGESGGRRHGTGDGRHHGCHGTYQPLLQSHDVTQPTRTAARQIQTKRQVYIIINLTKGGRIYITCNQHCIQFLANAVTLTLHVHHCSYRRVLFAARFQYWQQRGLGTQVWLEYSLAHPVPQLEHQLTRSQCQRTARAQHHVRHAHRWRGRGCWWRQSGADVRGTRLSQA